MSFTSGYFPNQNGDRLYSSQQIAAMNKAMMNSGVFYGYLNGLVVSKVSGTMNSSIDTGGAIIQGYPCTNDSAYTLTHNAADASNPRLDVVILRLSVSNRTLVPAILTGTPAPAPISIPLTQNGDIYEIPLANVLIPAAAATLNNATVSDRRSWAISNAQAITYAIGTYMGDGTSSKTISLGFTPSAVLILENGQVTYASSLITGELIVPAVGTNGFTVVDSGNVAMNLPNAIYQYIAFR